MNEIKLSPLALVFLAAASLIMLGSTRQNAVKALLVTAVFMPLGQQVVFVGLHFYFSRILILFGLMRLLIHGETRTFGFTTFDRLFVCWILVESLAGILRDGSEGIIGVAGFVYNSTGYFFLIRCLTREPDEFVDHLRFLAVVVGIMAFLMVPELLTGRNLFSTLGGVPLLSEIRDGRVRCQGSFRISILAGTFGATLFPLMAGLWFQGSRNKWRALLGMCGCTFITYASGSSGPLLSFLAALLGLGFWWVRDHMHLVRRGAVVTLIGLALVMKAPVWYVIDRVSSITGGSGWHRSYVIDQFIQHFSEWWLIGTSVTAHWAPAGLVLAVDPNNMDITNQFVAQGIGGGVLGLGLFVAGIVCGFKFVGRLVHADFELPVDRKLLWTLGVSLGTHCVAFLSVSYFDQINVFWFWLLAIIAGLAAWADRPVGLRDTAETDGSVDEPQAASLPIP